MKINSRYVYLLSALMVLAIAVSSVGAVEELVSNDFNNVSFELDIPSGSDFNEEARTNLNVGDVAMNMSVFSNHGGNANDVSTIMYLKDSSSNQNVVDEMINDLKKEGKIVEENDKYFVIDTKDSNNWNFFNMDIGNDLNSLFSVFDGFFSGDSNIDVSSNGTNIQASNDGIKIVDNDNSTVTLSNNGFQVNDANGENVSISTEGIKISGGEDENGTSADTDVFVDPDMTLNLGSDDYALCIENPDDAQIIVISGNNLDLLKSMAETVSFEK